MERDKIKAKISALLSKTTENGATEAEALIALNKANDLMRDYYISESELKDPYALDKCTLERVNLIKSAYDLKGFFGALSKLFDCFHFYSSQSVSFFGIEQDAKLCAFFYLLITRAALNEKDSYMKSIEYKVYSKQYSGKTLVASFLHGFIERITEKLREMYQNRNSTIPEGMGLVLIRKEEKVRSEYEALELDVRVKKPRTIRVLGECYRAGRDAGELFSITQGIEGYKKENTLALT